MGKIVAKTTPADPDVLQRSTAVRDAFLPFLVGIVNVHGPDVACIGVVSACVVIARSSNGMSEFRAALRLIVGIIDDEIGKVS